MQNLFSTISEPMNLTMFSCSNLRSISISFYKEVKLKVITLSLLIDSLSIPEMGLTICSFLTAKIRPVCTLNAVKTSPEAP